MRSRLRIKPENGSTGTEVCFKTVTILGSFGASCFVLLAAGWLSSSEPELVEAASGARFRVVPAAAEAGLVDLGPAEEAARLATVLEPALLGFLDFGGILGPVQL